MRCGTRWSEERSPSSERREEREREWEREARRAHYAIVLPVRNFRGCCTSRSAIDTASESLHTQ